MKPHNQSRKALINFQLDMDKNVLNSQDDPKIDKAKAELKILKKFISSRGEYGSDDKRIK